MNKSLSVFALFILSSCSLFTTKNLSQDFRKDIHKVCLSADGKGRLLVEEQKHVFSFESDLQQAQGQWIMALNFPLYGSESILLDWDEKGKYHYKFSFEDKIMRREKGISPQLLELFFATWGEFLFEMVRLKQNQNFSPNFLWSSSDKELSAQTMLKKVNANIKISFKNLTPEGHFGRYDIIMQHADGKIPFGVEMIVRNCLEKTE
jgi:hypothetical protein